MTQTKQDKQISPKQQVACEVFHRVVGYYRPVINFNNGKKEEFGDRTFFQLNESEMKSQKMPAYTQEMRLTKGAGILI